MILWLSSIMIAYGFGSVEKSPALWVYLEKRAAIAAALRTKEIELELAKVRHGDRS